MKPQDLERILAQFNADQQALLRVVFGLFQQQISDLTVRVKELEAQLAQHSGNSSRPPSSDGPKKPRKVKSSKAKGKKRSPGGQQGHAGRTLKMVPSEEARIEDHYPRVCGHCASDLRGQSSLDYDRRQVFDIPPLDIEITEHRAHYKQCPCCAQRTQGAFPAEASNNAVYGSNIRTAVSYLMVYQMLPYERTAGLLRDLFGLDLSQGTLDNILREADARLDTFTDQLGECLQAAEVVGFDETSIRAEDAQRYAHVARTEQHTLLYLGRRDYETMNQMGVLPGFEGVAVHDRYANYFGYDCEHSLCNAHLLRDLQVSSTAMPTTGRKGNGPRSCNNCCET